MEPPLALTTCVIVDNFEELKRLILVEKIDVNTVDSSGDTALHIAASKGRREMVQFLIANGANVNLANNLGSTPLHKAALANQIFIVEFLVKNGADRNIKNNSGLLAEQLAHLPRIKEFLEGGQSVTEELKVPREQHGRVIGAKGAVIRSLREKSGAQIIIPDKDAPGPGHITLRGRPAAVAAAKAAILELLATAPSLVIEEEGALNTGPRVPLPGEASPPGAAPAAANKTPTAAAQAAPKSKAPETTVNCPILKEKHKKILGGQNGATLKKLIQETGVRVVIPSATNSDAVIKVEGTQAAVDKAVAWLYQVTKEKDDKSGKREKRGAGEELKETRIGQTDMDAARRAILGYNKRGGLGGSGGGGRGGGSGGGGGRGGAAAGSAWTGERRPKLTREEDLASALFVTKKPEREPRKERRPREDDKKEKGEEKEGKPHENGVKAEEGAKLDTTDAKSVATAASESTDKDAEKKDTPASEEKKAANGDVSAAEKRKERKNNKAAAAGATVSSEATPPTPAAVEAPAPKAEEKKPEAAPTDEPDSVQQMIALLRSHGIPEKFHAKFRDELIDIEAARVLTDEQLEKLGLPMGVRAKLMAALRGTAPLASPTAASPAPKAKGGKAEAEEKSVAPAATAVSEEKKESPAPKKKVKNIIPGAVPAKPIVAPVVAAPAPVMAPVAAPEPPKDEWVTAGKKKKEKKPEAKPSAPASAAATPVVEAAAPAAVAPAAATPAASSKPAAALPVVVVEKEEADEWQTVPKKAPKQKAAKK